MRSPLRSITVLAIIVVSVLVSPGTSSASRSLFEGNTQVAGRPAGFPPENVDIAIVSSVSGRCLDADVHTGSSNGTKVQLWDCNNTRQQTWRVSYANASEMYIRSRLNNRCLDGQKHNVENNGAIVQLWDCNYELQQVWRLYVVSPDDRAFILKNQAATATFKVLDADTHTMNRNGTKIQLWDQNDEIQQTFFWNRY